MSSTHSACKIQAMITFEEISSKTESWQRKMLLDTRILEHQTEIACGSSEHILYLKLKYETRGLRVLERLPSEGHCLAYRVEIDPTRTWFDRDGGADSRLRQMVLKFCGLS